MEENCSIKLFESDLESMLSQVLAKARSRDEKLKAAKEKQCCFGRIPHLLYAGADGRNGNQKNSRIKLT